MKKSAKSSTSEKVSKSHQKAGVSFIQNRNKVGKMESRSSGSERKCGDLFKVNLGHIRRQGQTGDIKWNLGQGEGTGSMVTYLRLI
jgi:hypothetical protein